MLHEKSSRPPWQPRKGFTPENKGVKATYLTGADDADEGDDGVQDDDDEAMAEEDAVLLHEAYVAQETAKAKYREVVKARGVDPRVMKDNRRPPEDSKQSIEDRLASAKARSYCAGCGRKGHWHKDSVCPLNARQKQGDQQAHVTSSVQHSTHGMVVQVAYEVGDLGGGKLLAITDTACSKSVMGQGWLDDYLKLARAYLESKPSSLAATMISGLGLPGCSGLAIRILSPWRFLESASLFGRLLWMVRFHFS